MIRKYTKIAVIGVPCAVQAAARIRASENDLLRPYGNAIRLVVGLFCTETFDYAGLVHGKLEKKYKLAPHEVKKLDVKGKLVILKEDGTTLDVPLSDLEDAIRPGCHICTDFSSIEADLSAGAVGSPAGSTTLLVRNATGKGFVESAVRNGKLSVAAGADTAAIEKLAAAKIKKNSRK